MKTSMRTIVFFVVVLSISAISSLAEQRVYEDCMRRIIARSLYPPSNTHKAFNLEISDKLCRDDESRIVMNFLRRKGKFPPYYVEGLCNVFGSDEKKVKEYIITKWLNHSKKLLNNLTCKRSTANVLNKLEPCIKRSITLSVSSSPSENPNTSHFDVMRDQLCSDETRVIMHFLVLNGKFPDYYVEALCNVFGNDEQKVKVYITRKWLYHSKELIDSLTCASQ